jgi:hypothetical protein
MSESKKSHRKNQRSAGAFTDKLDAKSLEAFSAVAKKPFSEQACFFLNAFWSEFGADAEVIYNVHWEWFKKVDMHNRNVAYVHLYEEGVDLDFDMALYYFEQTVKYFNEDKEGKVWARDYPDAVPEMQTAIKRKKELRDTVDVNFDGRISLLEYLLYQYDASPKQLMDRATGQTNPELVKAMAALDDVNAQIKAYETEKARLEAESKKSGVRGLKAKNELAQLESGPLAEKLRMLLIKAEAALRKAKKSAGSTTGTETVRTDGAVWWLEREIQTKKTKYGKQKK